MTPAEAVRRARHELGWSQTKLATHAKVSRPTVARVEAGQSVSTGSLAKVVRALGLSLSVTAESQNSAPGQASPAAHETRRIK